TMKIDPFPVILVGSEFWSGLGEWLREMQAERFQTILPTDLNLFRMMDNVEEIADYLGKCEAGSCWQTTRGFPQIAPHQQITAEGTRYGVRPIVTPRQVDNGTADAVHPEIRATQNAHDFPQT